MKSIPSLEIPEAFGILEPKVYRSNAPQPQNFAFIRTLQLKTVLYLSPEIPVRAVKKFFEENSIHMIHLGLKTWRPDVTWNAMSEELFKEALQIILDASNHPIMVVCTSGLHQTGTLVGCLRRLQNWALSSIIEEYRSFAGSKGRYANEQYIELFDVDLISIPRNVPSWFAYAQDLMEQERDEFDRLQSSAAEAEAAAPSRAPQLHQRHSPLHTIIQQHHLQQQPNSHYSAISSASSSASSANFASSVDVSQSASIPPSLEENSNDKEKDENDSGSSDPKPIPSFKLHYFDVHGPLVSTRSTFSSKSLIEDDDD